MRCLASRCSTARRFQAEDRGSEIIAIPETCEANDAEALKKALIASGAEAAIGFLCTGKPGSRASRRWPRPVFPPLTLSVRSDILMEDALKKKWPFFRLVPTPRPKLPR